MEIRAFFPNLCFMMFHNDLRMFHDVLLVVHDVLLVVHNVFTMYHNVLHVFHDVLLCLASRAAIGVAASATADRLRDRDNAAGIGNNSAEIGDGAAGIAISPRT